MPCPFQHEGEKEPPRSAPPRGPYAWIKDWYLRDVNISRRVGWEGPTHDAFTFPFRAFDQALSRLVKKEKLDEVDVGWRMQRVLEEFERSRGVLMPRDAKGDVGGEVDSPAAGSERPYAAFWPPVEDKTFPGLYAPKDPVGSGGDQRPYRMFWAEEALAETLTPEVGYGTVMPGGTPSGLPKTPGTGSGIQGGYGHYQTMTETFQKMRDLISPKFRQMDPEL